MAKTIQPPLLKQQDNSPKENNMTRNTQTGSETTELVSKANIIKMAIFNARKIKTVFQRIHSDLSTKTEAPF